MTKSIYFASLLILGLDAYAEKPSAIYNFNFYPKNEVKTNSVAPKTKDIGVELVEIFFPKNVLNENSARDGAFGTMTARGETSVFQDISAMEVGVKKSLGEKWEGSLAYFRLEMNVDVDQKEPTYVANGVSVGLERLFPVYKRWFVNPHFTVSRAQSREIDYLGFTLGVAGEYRWRFLSFGALVFSNNYSIQQKNSDRPTQKGNLSSLYGGLRLSYFF